MMEKAFYFDYFQQEWMEIQQPLLGSQDMEELSGQVVLRVKWSGGQQQDYIWWKSMAQLMRLSEDSRDFDPAEDRGCCSLSSVEDARRVAEVIGIPHYVMNFKELFQQRVIDNFLSEYSRGRTPNPCVVCNRYVKFEGLLQKSLELGAQYVATGHYARIYRDEASGRYVLAKGVDVQKDQSYALYHLNQHSLQHFLMKSENVDMSHLVTYLLMRGIADS